MATATSSFTTPTLSGITSAAAGVVTTSGAHGWTVGDVVSFQGLNEMTGLNGTTAVIRTVPSSTTFTIQDTSSFDAETTGGADTCNLSVDISGYLRTGKKGEDVAIAISGTYVNTIHLERATNSSETAWEKVYPSDTWKTDNDTVAEVYLTEKDNEVLRLRATAATPTGTVTATLIDAAKVIQSFVDDDGNELFQVTEDGVRFRGTLTVDGASTLTGNVQAAGTLGVTGIATLATASKIGNLTLGDGSIVDSGGAIDFGNEALLSLGAMTGKMLILDIADDTDTLQLTQALHANRILRVLDASLAITLAEAVGSGDVYFILQGIAATSSTITAEGSGTFYGRLVGVDTDAPTTLYEWEATPGSSSTITFDGTAKGGKIYDWIRVTDVAADKWLLEGHLSQSGGSEVTPIS